MSLVRWINGSPWRGAALAALAALAIYAPFLSGGFVYDSVLQVGLDDYLHQPAHLTDVVSLRVLAQDEIDRNRPVQLASLMMDALVWGREPFGFRLTSALLHAGVCALIFLLAVRWAETRLPSVSLAALAAAVLVAWHPLGVEAVSDPSNREDVLAALFLLWALFLFSKPRAAATGCGVGRGAAVVLCGLLSAGSKEVGWMAPGVLAAVWWWIVRPRRGTHTGDAVTLGVSAVAVGLLAAAILGLKPSGTDVFLFTPESWTWAQWFERQPGILAGQLERIVFPLRLSPDYAPANLAPWAFSWSWIVPVVLATASGVALWRWRASRPGVVLFALALLPSANLLPQFNFFADRFLYLPLAGMALAVVPPLASLGRRWTSPRGRAALFVVWFVVAVSFAARTWQYQRVWYQERTLWDATLVVNPSSWNALLGAGAVRFEAGEFSEADPFWSEMRRRAPDDGVALALAAVLEEELGRSAEADRLMARALRAEPTLADSGRYARYYGWRPRLRAALDSLIGRAKMNDQ